MIVRHLVDQGYLDSDGGMLFIGPEAERQFGRRHFMEMTAVFTGAPEFTVLHGRTELGRIDPSLLTEEVAATAGCCSAAAAGGSPTSTGAAAAASSNPPTAAEGPAGRPRLGRRSASSWAGRCARCCSARTRRYG